MHNSSSSSSPAWLAQDLYATALFLFHDALTALDGVSMNDLKLMRDKLGLDKSLGGIRLKGALAERFINNFCDVEAGHVRHLHSKPKAGPPAVQRMTAALKAGVLDAATAAGIRSQLPWYPRRNGLLVEPSHDAFIALVCDASMIGVTCAGAAAGVAALSDENVPPQTPAPALQMPATPAATPAQVPVSAPPVLGTPAALPVAGTPAAPPVAGTPAAAFSPTTLVEVIRPLLNDAVEDLKRHLNAKTNQQTCELNAKTNQQTGELKSHTAAQTREIKHHAEERITALHAAITVQIKQSERKLTRKLTELDDKNTQLATIKVQREYAAEQLAAEQRDLAEEEAAVQSAAQIALVKEMRESVNRLQQSLEAKADKEKCLTEACVAVSEDIAGLRARGEELARDHALAASARHVETMEAFATEAEAREMATAAMQATLTDCLHVGEATHAGVQMLAGDLLAFMDTVSTVVASQPAPKTTEGAPRSGSGTAQRAAGLKSVLSTLPGNKETKQMCVSLARVLGSADFEVKEIGALGRALLKKLGELEDKDVVASLLAIAFFSHALGSVFTAACVNEHKASHS